MRTYLKALACVLPLTLALTAACEDSITTNPAPNDTATSTSGSGGNGGDSTTTTTSAGGTTTTSASGGAGTGGGFGGGNACEQACNYIENTCGFSGACAQVGLDCNNPQSECPGQCILAATCAQIISLASQNPDPTLAGCLQSCQGGTGGMGQGGGNQMSCGQCAQANCNMYFAPCQQDSICQGYFQCVTQCQTPQCEQACLANNNSTASVNLSTCICGNCGSNCPTCP